MFSNSIRQLLAPSVFVICAVYTMLRVMKSSWITAFTFDHSLRHNLPLLDRIVTMEADTFFILPLAADRDSTVRF